MCLVWHVPIYFVHGHWLPICPILSAQWAYSINQIPTHAKTTHVHLRWERGWHSYLRLCGQFTSLPSIMAGFWFFSPISFWQDPLSIISVQFSCSMQNYVVPLINIVDVTHNIECIFTICLVNGFHTVTKFAYCLVSFIAYWAWPPVWRVEVETWNL